MRHRSFAVALAAIVAGCATDPYALRDYAAVIEQARKVGAGEPHAPAGAARAPEKAAAPCPVAGKPVGARTGAHTGAVGGEATVAHESSDDCRTTDNPPARVAH